MTGADSWRDFTLTSTVATTSNSGAASTPTTLPFSIMPLNVLSFLVGSYEGCLRWTGQSSGRLFRVSDETFAHSVVLWGFSRCASSPASQFKYEVDAFSLGGLVNQTTILSWISVCALCREYLGVEMG